MKKNVAGQKMGIQLTNAADGTPFTGSATIYITLDAGTQAVGALSAGAMTHEGRGYHTYAPSQAETNGDLVAWTATGSGAINASCQVYTSFPQTGDSFARVGAPVGASISADLAAVQADTDNIQTRLPAALVSGRMDSSAGAIAAGVITSTAVATGAITSTTFASGAITAASLATDAGTEIADAILNRDMSVGTDSGSPTVRTVRQALRFLRNKWTLIGTSLNVYKEDDATSSWTSTVTPAPGADPVSGSDPA